MDDELKRLIEQARAAGASDDEIYRAISVRQARTQQQKPKEGFIKRNLPTIGAVGAGIAAAPFTSGMSLLPALGIAAGAGAAGAAAGSYARQGLTKPEIDPEEVLKEAKSGAIGGAAGQGLGMAFKGASALLGKGASKVGESFAIRGLRPTKTQLAKFAAQHGEDMSTVLQRYGAQGMEHTQLVDDIIKPLQQSFDSIVKNTKIPVPRKILDKNFYSKIKTLLNSGDVDDVRIAEKIIKQYDNLIGNNKALSLAQVNKFRGNFDSKVKSFITADPLRAGEKRVIADALRDSVREVADTSGLTVGGRSLAEIGRELSKLYDIDKIATLQSYLGKGTLPVGLTTLLGAVAGGTPGGVGGAITGLVGTQMINNPKIIKLISQMATNAGEKLSGQGVKAGTRGVLSNALPLIAGQVGARSFGTQARLPEEELLPSDINQINMTDQTSTPATEQMNLEFARLMAEDLAKNKGANIPEIQAVYDMIQPVKSSTKLSDTAIKNINDAQTALTSLENLSQILAENPSQVGPIAGLQALSPWSGSRKTQAEIDRVRQMVGKALEGGVLRKEDEEKYKKILPTIRDTQDVAQYKIQTLYQMIQRDMQNYINLQSSVGGGGYNLPQNVQDINFNY